MAEIKTKLYQV